MTKSGKLQAALLRVSMELRFDRSMNLEQATGKVALKMHLDQQELGTYLRAHLSELMNASRPDYVREKR